MFPYGFRKLHGEIEVDISEACKMILEELQQTKHLGDLADTDRLIDAILGAKRVFVSGAGRSGLMVRAFAMRLMQTGIEVHVVGETTTPRIGKDDLFLVGSGSGSTGGPLNHTRIARSSGATVALVTAARSSPIREISDIVIRLHAPIHKAQTSENGAKSQQPLGTLFEQSMLLYLDAVTVMLMEQMDVDTNALLGRHTTLE